MAYHHIAVMVEEVIRYLNCSSGKTIVDGTLGGGGHARAILRAIGPEGFLIGIDQDAEAVAWAHQTFRDYESNIQLFHDNFASLQEILHRSNKKYVDGILLDLGLSLHQIERSGRGFSFMRDERLDMRMNPNEELTAEILVNSLPEKELADLIFRYGEERFARSIAKRIVQARQRQRIVSSLELADLVRSAIPGKHRPRRIHPATKTFQALRVAVNQELEKLEAVLDQAVSCLSTGGRLCILSFHSLEDRIVKQRFKALAQGCQCPREFPVCRCGHVPQVRILTRKPVQACSQEVAANPMARSAKLRALEKLEVA
jgi:16S rRNA (cytosine1402-N4)-methyltransferase